MKKKFIQLFIFLFTSVLTIFVIEIFLTLKNKYIIDYDIEMWKYSKLLKERSLDSNIGHVHKKNNSANLQKVNIKINNLGMRGKDVNINELRKYDEKILILGSSIALGWGVDQEKTFPYLIEKKLNQLGKSTIVLNAGVGNYNTKRYVTNYFKNLSELKPDKIFILFFVNDTEILKNNYGNVFTRNFHFAVLIWKYINTINEEIKFSNIKEYYMEKFTDDYEGFLNAKKDLTKLNNHCIDQKIQCTLVVMPDIHNLVSYELGFIHEKMISFSKEIGLNSLDLLPFFINKSKKDLWNKYNDPHPNENGHQIIATAILENLE